MIYVDHDSNGDVINLTRGDDAVIEVPLTINDDEPYEMDSHDYMIFAVRELPSPDSPLLLSIESEHGVNKIVFSHDDTRNMNVGAYSAEIQLMTSDNMIYTVWPRLKGASKTSKANRKNFVLMTEVVRE